MQAHFERSNVGQALSAGIIGEAMAELGVADTFPEKFGDYAQPETRRNYKGYVAMVGPWRV